MTRAATPISNSLRARRAGEYSFKDDRGLMAFHMATWRQAPTFSTKVIDDYEI